MNTEEAMKLREGDCVLIGGFVRKPAAGTQAGDSVLDENGVIELDVPAVWNTRPLYVKPEHIVSRCAGCRGLMVGDIVWCSSSVATGVGFVIEFHNGAVMVKLANNCFEHLFSKRNVTLLIGVEEVQDRVERARFFAAHKKAYAKGGIVALEAMADAASAEEGGEA